MSTCRSLRSVSLLYSPAMVDESTLMANPEPLRLF